jgi:nucleotide-binding universal stress UspA family protein
MIAIRIVVCPVDFSEATSRQVDLAADVCRAFGARLVLHHNVTDVSVGASVGWMWHADHEPPQPASVDERLRALVDRLPAGIDVETCITRGAVTEAVLKVSDAAEADLIVLSAHKGKTDDHASVIGYLIEHSNRAVLAMHDAGGDASVPRFRVGDGERYAMQAILVPVNLASEAHAQVDFACELARQFPLRLHLLHVTEPRLGREGRPTSADLVVPRLEALVPPDLARRAAIHVTEGDTVPSIARWARDLGVSCIVMGEHTRVPVKRWLTHDTSRAVLAEAPCPVWYVPTTRRAPLTIESLATSTEKSILWDNV